MLAESLSVIATALIAALVFVYVVLDGFDLGVGLLLPLAADRQERQAFMATTSATTLTSELWLILAAVAMYLSFPAAFSVLAQALAIPIAAMLAALVVRMIAAAARTRAGDRGEAIWSWLFVGASAVAVIAQGFVLGGYLRGTSVAGDGFVGDLFAWATPFSVLVAITLATGYALLGATWLVFSARGASANRARRWSARLAIAAALAMGAISVATLFVHPGVSLRWGISSDGVDWRDLALLAPLPAAAAICLIATFVLASRATTTGASLFFCAVGAFAAGYGGLIASVWPYIVPYGFTIESAADPQLLTANLPWIGAEALCLVVVSTILIRSARKRAG